MKCREFLSLAACPPASGGPSEEFDGHARECQACREAIEADRLFSERERALLVEPAPPLLAARVFEEIGRARSMRRTWRALIGAAAVILLFAGGRILLDGGPEPLEGALARDHIEYLAVPNPAEYATADTGTLARWFGGHFPFAVDVPRLRDAQLLGGRRCKLAGYPAALALYESGGRRVSVFVLPPEAPFRSLPCLRTERGVNVLAVEHRGLRYAFAGDLPAEQLLGWAEDVTGVRPKA
ncbi:MAG: hypothetical protein IT186_12475 [Acidobacteria bacterium]|nr:hypothetical protein [Acidobacteriota bacterium]MCG3193779.1 hypothetical protein [Thermoanaerobaculia bacterium]